MSSVPDVHETAQPKNGAALPPPITMDWETFYAPGPIGVLAPDRAAFRAAVAAVANQLLTVCPESRSRIHAAVNLVLAGDVELLPDGTAKVASQRESQTGYYVVNGTCECKDFPKAPDRFCKHLFAAGMARRALALVQERPAAQPQDNLHPIFEDVVEDSRMIHEEKPAPTPAFGEAPYSVNVRVLKGGYAFQLTVRKADNSEFLKTLDTLPEWLAAHGFAPLSGKAESATDPADTPAPTLPPSCRYHGTQNMKPSKFGEGKYVCSVKLADDSYCNQTWPAKAKGQN